MKLDVRATKIDENSEFGRYFAREAGSAFRNVFYGNKGSNFPANDCNKAFKNMRRSIDSAMMDYLVEHDGVIDGWPNPKTSLYQTYSSGSSNGVINTYYFHYFGTDYGPFGRKWGLDFHDEYKYEHSKEYKDALYKGEYHGVSPFDNNIERAKKLACQLPWIIAILSAIMNVLCFLGVDIMEVVAMAGEVSQGEGQLLGLGTLDKVIPAILVFGLGLPFLPSLLFYGLAESFGAIVLLLGGIVTLVIGKVATKLLLLFYEPSPVSQKAIKQEIKATKEYRRSEEYRRIVGGEDAQKAEYEAISRQWHNLWFDFYRKNYQGDYYYDDKATSEEMREQLRLREEAKRLREQKEKKICEEAKATQASWMARYGEKQKESSVFAILTRADEHYAREEYEEAAGLYHQVANTPFDEVNAVSILTAISRELRLSQLNKAALPNANTMPAFALAKKFIDLAMYPKKGSLLYEAYLDAKKAPNIETLKQLSRYTYGSYLKYPLDGKDIQQVSLAVDCVVAVLWHQEAEKGNIRAYMPLHGFYNGMNHSKSVYWGSEALEANIPEALYGAAHYPQEYGVNLSAEEAYDYLCEAASRGHEMARTELYLQEEELKNSLLHYNAVLENDKLSYSEKINELEKTERSISYTLYGKSLTFDMAETEGLMSYSSYATINDIKQAFLKD